MGQDLNYPAVVLTKKYWLQRAVNEFILLLTEKRRNNDSSGLHGVSGNNWIPSVVLCKGQYRREESGDSLSAGSTFSMTPKGYITTGGFCKIFASFQSSSTN
jgi:hypothetical protein